MRRANSLFQYDECVHESNSVAASHKFFDTAIHSQISTPIWEKREKKFVLFCNSKSTAFVWFMMTVSKWCVCISTMNIVGLLYNLIIYCDVEQRVVQVYEDGKSNLPHTLFLIRFSCFSFVIYFVLDCVAVKTKQKITTYSKLYGLSIRKKTKQQLKVERWKRYEKKRHMRKCTKLTENNEFWTVQRIPSRKEHEMYIHAENQNKCWSWNKRKIGTPLYTHI